MVNGELFCLALVIVSAKHTVVYLHIGYVIFNFTSICDMRIRLAEMMITAVLFDFFNVLII